MSPWPGKIGASERFSSPGFHATGKQPGLGERSVLFRRIGLPAV